MHVYYIWYAQCNIFYSVKQKYTVERGYSKNDAGARIPPPTNEVSLQIKVWLTFFLKIFTCFFLNFLPVANSVNNFRCFAYILKFLRRSKSANC